LCPRYDTERMRDEGGIVTRLLKYCIKVRSNIFLGRQVLSGVPFAQFGFCHVHCSDSFARFWLPTVSAPHPA
jgi:hypothetical protein